MEKFYTYTHRILFTSLEPLEHSRKYFKNLASVKQAIEDEASQYAAKIADYLANETVSEVSWTDNKLNQTIFLVIPCDPPERSVYRKRVYFVDDCHFES